VSLPQSHRLLTLIRLLQAGRGYNTKELAGACRVSRRTIFRDLDAMRQSGLPLVFDEGSQQYRLTGGACLPPLHLTPEEALAMVLLCHELGKDSGLPFLGPARSAAVKIESSLPIRLREHVSSLAHAVEIRTVPLTPMEQQGDVYLQLLAAMAARSCVRISYHSLAERQEIGTRLNPYRLLFSRRSWYVIGRSSLHRSTRTFNLERIRRLEPLSQTYSIPRGFSVDHYLRNAWHLIPEPGPDREILIRFSPMVAENVAEVLWHKTQRMQFNDDGTLDYHVRVSGLNEISWWSLGYGDQAEVIEPPELRRLVGQRAARTAGYYLGDLPEAARPLLNTEH
jgi:proteasome accessory factor B